MLLGTTKEGLRYVVRKRVSSSAAFCALTIGGGTRAEMGLYPEGTAHFVEHTLFKGTSRRRASAINSYLERMGGELNAFTTKEEIVLHSTVLKRDLRRAADLLLELALDPIFPQREIDKERGVVIDEIQSYKDVPADDIFDRFESLFFRGHPLSHLILGTARSLKSITREDLLSFNRRFFQYDNMVLSLVAPVAEKELEKWVCALSAKWAECNASRASQPVAQALSLAAACETLPFEPKVINPPFERHISKRNHQVNCVYGGPAPSLSDKQSRIATILLCNILGGPSSNSILNSLLREKNGWVYGVECNYIPYADTGLMNISFGCEKENKEKCLQLIRREMARLREKELTTAQLSRACRQILGQLAISADSGEAQAISAGKSMLVFNTVKSEEENKAALMALTPAFLQKVAQLIFDEEKMSLLVYE